MNRAWNGMEGGGEALAEEEAPLSRWCLHTPTPHVEQVPLRKGIRLRQARAAQPGSTTTVLAEKHPGKCHAVGRKLENKCELGSGEGSAGWLQVGWSLPGLSQGAMRPPLCCWGEPSGLKRTSETPETRQSQDGINGRNLAHKSPVGGWQLWAQLVTVPWVVGHQAALFPWSPAGSLSGHPALDQLLCQFLSLGPLHHNGKFANLPPNQSGLGVPVFQRFFSPKEKERIKWYPSTPVYLQPLRSSLNRILLPVSCVASVRSMPCKWQCIQSMRHIPFSLALSLTIWISLQISAYWPFFILPMSTLFCCSLMFITSPLLLSLFPILYYDK